MGQYVSIENGPSVLGETAAYVRTFCLLVTEGLRPLSLAGHPPWPSWRSCPQRLGRTECREIGMATVRPSVFRTASAVLNLTHQPHGTSDAAFASLRTPTSMRGGPRQQLVRQLSFNQQSGNNPPAPGASATVGPSMRHGESRQ